MAFIQITKDQAKEKVKELVDAFKENIDQYKNQIYKEAQVRKEFIDPFFEALGWDVSNQDKRAEQYKEVINEDSIKVEGNTKAPDYSFRIGGTRIFFVEAKKPSIKIKDELEPAYQLRRYAWNIQIPISILSDFEELAVYDCRKKPNNTDNSSVARIMYLTYNDYLDRFEEIWSVFSKEAVLKGSFDRFVESSKDKKGTSEVDVEFLKEIEKWRDTLAKNIALRNSKQSITELNYSVQKTIDRILFLIICEYRSIEKYEKLKEIAEKDHIYKNLIYYFEKSDEKYNSGIFDFKNDNCTKDLIIDDKILRNIILNLYYPKSPYDFSILSIEIIGKVYEQFLGKTIRLTSSHQAKIEEKPEIRKAGGIYYTPEFVVEYILENTIGKLIKDKTPKQIEKIKILDSACGSGTFLVRAYNYLLNYHLNWYIANNPEKHKKEVYSYKDGYLLSTDIKKKILLNNLFGVDIDPQAVEITKLSLLLKVLENENKEKVEQQLKLFNERILPNIDNNIKCGNSVVDSSYFSQTTITNKSQEDIIRINPFDWRDRNTGFGNIIADGGFDIIIGNPPYVKEYTNQEIFEPVKQSHLSKYYQGKMDFWYLFTCQAIDLLKEGGLHSYIAPSNWITNAGASILRNKILQEGKILSFFDFNDYRVFKDASIQTMVFVIQKEKSPKSYFVDYYKIIDKNISKEELRNYLATKKAGKKIEYIKSKINTTELLNKTINFTSIDTNKILDYLKEKGNFLLTDKDVGQGIVAPQDMVNDKHLVVLKDSSIKKGDGIFNLSKLEFDKLNLSQKEKTIIKPFYTTIELKKYYGSPKNQFWVIYSDIKIRQSISEYPNIKVHLDRFKSVITSDFAPYGLHRAREQNLFEGEKIISLRKTTEPCFTFTDFPCYVSQTYFIIKPKDIDLMYLTGLLNSKLIYFWLKHKGKKQGEQLQIDKAPLLEIPIHKPTLNDKGEQKLEKEVIQSVDAIIELSKKLEFIKLDSEKQLINKQIKANEDKINEIIYKLYGLTEQDTMVIETI
jgi:adenine-specific DNA-methyltransferase